MRPWLLCVVALLLSTAAARGERRVVAYVPTWVDLKSFSETIDYPKLTHVNVAFANPSNDEGELSFNEKATFLIDRARAAP